VGELHREGDRKSIRENIDVVAAVMSVVHLCWSVLKSGEPLQAPEQGHDPID
jgi:hypothetical protein